MIDVTSLNNLISALGLETEQNSITPQVVANILQQISDLLASTALESDRKAIADWIANIKNITSVYTAMEQGSADRNNIYINVHKANLSNGSTSDSNNALMIKQATTDRAGAMRAQQVIDLNAATKNISALQSSLEQVEDDIDDIQSSQTKQGERISALENGSGTSSAGLPHIYCQDVGGMLYVRGIENVNMTDYVPYLFRYSSKRNHHRDDNDNQVYGPRKRGWHVYIDYERIKVSSSGMVTFRDVISGPSTTSYYTNARYALGKASVKAISSSQLASAKIGFGNKSYDLMKGVRFPFAIGFAPKWTDKANAFDMKTLKTSLATFHIYAKAVPTVSVFDNIHCGFSR